MQRTAYFWDDRPPQEVKFTVEQLTRVLLERDAGVTERLAFTGISTAGGDRRLVRLRFEAVGPLAAGLRNQYVLQVEASAPRKWVKEEDLRRDLNRRFDDWAARLQAGPGCSGWEETLRPEYDDRVRASLAALAKAAERVEDPGPITQIQQAILQALRSGRSFSRAHKEGGSILSCRAGRFRRDDYGEETGVTEFQTEEEMLRAIRQFYDWESRRDTYPHRPPELEVWQYIQRQLR